MQSKHIQTVNTFFWQTVSCLSLCAHAHACTYTHSSNIVLQYSILCCNPFVLNRLFKFIFSFCKFRWICEIHLQFTFSFTISSSYFATQANADSPQEKISRSKSCFMHLHLPAIATNKSSQLCGRNGWMLRIFRNLNCL